MQKPSAQDTLAAYQRINSGYRRKAVFQLDPFKGFSANINRMILMMLYCLVYKFQFQLGSNFWPLDKKAGGMFVPFCPESNFQPPRITQDMKNLYKLEYALRWKKRHPFVLNLNFALNLSGGSVPNMAGNSRNPLGYLGWRVMNSWLRRRRKRGKTLFNQHFLFPELGIDGEIFHAERVIAKMILEPGAKVADEHRAAVESLKPYIGVHVRRGQKLIREAKGIKVPEYLEKIQSLAPDIRTIFVATDDYRVVADFQKLRPDLNIVTLCDKEKKGHFHRDFMGSLRKEEEWAEFLVDLYYLENADHFVGTYSSNVGRLVALLRGRETCHSLDREWGPRQADTRRQPGRRIAQT